MEVEGEASLQALSDRRQAVSEAAAGLNQDLVDGLLNLLDKKITRVNSQRSSSYYTKKEC
jgi:hypothetical protein